MTGVVLEAFIDVMATPSAVITFISMETNALVWSCKVLAHCFVGAVMRKGTLVRGNGMRTNVYYRIPRNRYDSCHVVFSLDNLCNSLDTVYFPVVTFVTSTNKGGVNGLALNNWTVVIDTCLGWCTNTSSAFLQLSFYSLCNHSFTFINFETSISTLKETMMALAVVTSINIDTISVGITRSIKLKVIALVDINASCSVLVFSVPLWTDTIVVYANRYTGHVFVASVIGRVTRVYCIARWVVYGITFAFITAN